MPRINLVPWREAERKRKRQEFALGAVSAIVLAAIIALAVRIQMQGAVDDQRARNQYLETEIAELDKQIAEILALDQQKQRLLDRMQVIEQLERSRPEIVHVFDQLVRTTPDGIYLTSIKQTDRKIQVQGVAQSSTRVASFMRNIDSSEWLKEPSLDILETKGDTDAGSQFTLNAVQENPQIATNADEADAAPSPAEKGKKGSRPAKKPAAKEKAK